MMTDFDNLQNKDMPSHIAIIMDGNRRWAQRCGLEARHGHARGVDAMREIVRAAHRIPIKFLTLYGFSTSNWDRSGEEVQGLMDLLRSYIRSDLAELHENHIQLRILGRRDDLTADILRLMDEAEELTKNNQGMVLSVAFNYGGRDELVRAMQKIASKVRDQGLQPKDIDMEAVQSALDTHDMPPVDLLIRTGGEQRLSDFLLWQNAYAEFVFTDIFWPDFTSALFIEAVHQYGWRHRRFGADARAAY